MLENLIQRTSNNLLDLSQHRPNTIAKLKQTLQNAAYSGCDRQDCQRVLNMTQAHTEIKLARTCIPEREALQIECTQLHQRCLQCPTAMHINHAINISVTV